MDVSIVFCLHVALFYISGQHYISIYCHLCSQNYVHLFVNVYYLPLRHVCGLEMRRVIESDFVCMHSIYWNYSTQFGLAKQFNHLFSLVNNNKKFKCGNKANRLFVFLISVHIRDQSTTTNPKFPINLR